VLPDFTRLLDPEGEYDAAVLSGVNPLPYSHSPSHFLAEKTIDFVKRRDERPFFAYLSPLEPHHPYFPTREFADLYTDRIGEIWDEKVIDDFPMKAAVQADFDYVRSRLDGAQFRDVLDRYLGLITEADASIGKVFSYLESAKLMDDTVIIVTADHGDMMGDFGLLFKDRMYEASARVPFLFYHPQFQRAGRIERVASHVDLLPTFLELAGGAVPPHLPGKSLLPFLSDPAHVNHRAVFSFGQRLEASEQLKIERVTKLREAKKELMADRAQMPARAMVRTESHKAIYAGVGGAWDSVELYDLDRDPDELTDLAGQPGQAATLAEMGALLKDWEDDVRLEAERLKAMRRDEKALP
jgi:choline-sulfatase